MNKKERVLWLIDRPEGATNTELSKITLRYGSSIDILRKDGHDIPKPEKVNENGLYVYKLRKHKKQERFDLEI